MIDERGLGWLLPTGVGLALTSLAGLVYVAFAPAPGRSTTRATAETGALAASDSARAKTVSDGAAAKATGSSPATAVIDVAAVQRLEGFLQRFEPEAEAAGVSRATFQAFARGLQPDPEVLTLSTTQPEIVSAPWDYLARLVTPARIEGGRLHLARLAGRISIIEARYGVDRHVLTAIWGIESNYGSRQGERSVARSLATLAASDPRRGAFWKSELLQALLILERGETTSDRLVGSWAGAMGHTQFMPSTFAAHAVDFDRDGRRDIWSSAEDGLASAANFLKASGWRTGLPWGFEVVLPGTLDPGKLPLDRSEPFTTWLSLGIRPARLRPPPPEAATFDLILPGGITGPAFLVSRNFTALLRYNNSSAYVLAVGHLADRIAGEEGFVGRWPEEERMLKTEGVLELQRQLTALGFDTGAADGIVGSRTRAAARAYQSSRGLAADGFVTERLLERVRGDRAP